MIDLKTVKNITISEGSVTKITNSSGVVLWQKQTGSSSFLDVDLNNQWVESNKTLSGYKVYMSNSNKGVNNGYASMKFKFKGMPDFKIWINSYAESDYDYTIAWNLDVDFPTSNPSNSTSGVKAYTKYTSEDPTTIDNFKEVDYSNDGGEHFVVVTYRKDSSYNANDDRGYVAVKEIPTSTTYVLSSTEFVKKDDKYYQRLNEVETYADGSTALTGNYKEGNELTVTYKQGSADDYILVGSGKYYKKYAYVTPKDQEINTGDYIQGDYIGEATPSMKVTYKDGSEKTFYNLTNIDRDTDSNKANAKEVVLYDGVTEIGMSAFDGCGSITSVTISDSVRTINDYAFNKCSSLTGITIPNGITRIASYAFSNCSSLTNIVIPDSVTNIDDYAFMYCKSLTSVSLSDRVIRIGKSAFASCSNLQSITIPSGVSYIGPYAFSGCEALTSVTIPNSVTSISNYTFYGCSSLTGITIPNSVTSIGENAFTKCSNFASVTISNSTNKLAYSKQAFAGISSSAKLYVPSNLLADYQSDTSWTGAFGGGIFEIQIPAMKVIYTDNTEKTFYNLTSINSDTDSNKKNAKEVEIYSGVKYIGQNAFNKCSSLTSVTIPDSVTSIGWSAFSYCTSLPTVTTPDKATLDQYSFIGCTNLASVTIKYSSYKLTYSNQAFNKISPTAKLYVPSNLVSSYQSDKNWRDAFKGGIYAIPS